VAAFLGSLLFTVLVIVSVIGYTPTFLVQWAMPFRWRYEVARSWTRLSLWLLQVLCKIDHEVEGTENLPSGAAIVLSKHQSAWETLAFQVIFPPLVWVMKRELTWVPVFGWALALLEPIAINRGSGRRAVRAVIQQARKRLKDGRRVVIFPEGTRVAPGTRRRWGIGGAALAANTGYPVVPVAHNAGELWPRRGFVKHPGTVRVVIGAAIDPTGKSAAEINRIAQEWMDAQMQRISSRPQQ